MSDSEASHWEQLASISYAWMLDRIRPYLAFDPEELEAQQADWDAMLRPPTVEEVEKARKAQGVVQRVIKWFHSGADDDKPGYAAGKITDSHTGVYDLLGRPQDRIPLNISEEDIAAGKYTHEFVHFSVEKRQEALAPNGYIPQALKGWERRPRATGGFEWVKEASRGEREKVMPEFEVGSVPAEWSMESWLLGRTGGQ